MTAIQLYIETVYSKEEGISEYRSMGASHKIFPCEMSIRMDVFSTLENGILRKIGTARAVFYVIMKRSLICSLFNNIITSDWEERKRKKRKWDKSRIELSTR